MKFVTPYIAFSAPSGTGKTTIVRRLVQKYPHDLVISISATTRAPRPGELDGSDYDFWSRPQFEQAIKEGKFLEYEEVHNELYGTLLDKVQSLRAAGKTVLFDIDVKGAKSVKRKFPEAVIIFLKPPNQEELARRLKKRRSETPEAIQRRLERLEFEYLEGEKFDFCIVNDHFDLTIADIEKIIISE